MASSQDTEITLGTPKLLGLFFGLVAVCAVFFALGYMLGRRSDAAVSAAAVGSALQSASSGVKPGSSATPAPPMTFYKAVEQKDASAQLTPASEDANPSATGGQGSESQATESESTRAMPAATSSDPTVAAPTTGYLVQVAAVSKQDDADALVDALKKKQYPAFVAANSAMDRLFRVQVGPFSDIKAAESMRSRLVDDGYNPILKK